jgi:exonuclease SbcD
MPRLLHMADVHLGARHDDLGPAASAQRERQFAAFNRAVELAISEKVDLVLIAGDLFDSNAQPRRSVERAAAELGRLAQRSIPVVVIPGTHDCYEPSSIYRVFDLPALAGSKPGSQMVTVLTDSQPRVDFPQLDITVHGMVSPTKRAAHSPLANFSAVRKSDLEEGANGSRTPPKPMAWQVGMIHGSLAVPGKFDQDDVMFTEAEVAASGLHYLALGHWHSFREGRAGHTVWAYSGAPEPVAVDQDGAGQVLLVDLVDRDNRATVTVQPRPVGKTKFEKLELDAATLTSQADLERMLRERADPDRVLDVRLVGMKAEQLDLNVDELERQLHSAFLRLRVRDSSIASLPEAPLAPPDTILGAFTRDFGARIADHEARGDNDRAAELREALRLGALLLDDPQRVTLA